MPQSFKHFLDTVKQEAPSPGEEAVQGEGEAIAPSGRMLLLQTLRTQGPTPVEQLRAESGLEFTNFANAVKTFLDAGLIEMSGTPGSEVVALTEHGAAVAALEL